MITRAQAEALLTLAESLEACERVGLSIAADHKGVVVYWGNASVIDLEITGAQIRKIVIGLCPVKPEPEVDKNCYWCFGTGITQPEQGVTKGGYRCEECKSADALDLRQ